MAMYVKDMSSDDLREMIEDTVRATLENYIEDLQALASPEYLASVAEAREDYSQGRAVPLEDLQDGVWKVRSRRPPPPGHKCQG